MIIKTNDFNFNVLFFDVDVDYWSKQIRNTLEDFNFILINELRRAGISPSEFSKALIKVFGLECPTIQIGTSFSESYVDFDDGIVRILVPKETPEEGLSQEDRLDIITDLSHEFRHLVDYLFFTTIETESEEIEEYWEKPEELSAIISEIRTLLQQGMSPEEVMDYVRETKGVPKAYVESLMSYASLQEYLLLETPKQVKSILVDPFKRDPETGKLDIDPEAGLAFYKQTICFGLDDPFTVTLERRLRELGKGAEVDEIKRQYLREKGKRKEELPPILF